MERVSVESSFGDGSVLDIVEVEPWLCPSWCGTPGIDVAPSLILSFWLFTLGLVSCSSLRAIAAKALSSASSLRPAAAQKCM